jgi:hypothetical protein
MILEIDLIPSTSFYNNARAKLSKKEWQIIANSVRSTVYNICQICDFAPEKSLDVHEIWEYDEVNLIQKLVGLIALCKSCHGVKHYGLSQIQGKEKQAYNHFKKINKLTDQQAKQEIVQAFQTWANRSQKQWELDLSYLNNFSKGIK